MCVIYDPFGQTHIPPPVTITHFKFVCFVDFKKWARLDVQKSRVKIVNITGHVDQK